MNSISPNLNLMIKACEKASKILIRDFGEIEKLQVSKKGPSDFVTKLLGPFRETCNFSTSPKSLIKIFDAFSEALIIKFKFEDIEIILNFFNVFQISSIYHYFIAHFNKRWNLNI